MEKKKCFIITPIGNEGSDIRKKTEGIISAVIEPVLDKNGYEIIIAHKISEPGSITNQIISHIINDELVIANLTGLNPNVMYELAIRHAKRKPVICIIEKNTQLPFDLAADRAIFYEDNMAGVMTTHNALDQAIKGIKDDENTDNPIYRAIQNEIFLIQNESINQMAQKIKGEDGNTLKIILDKLTLIEQTNKEYIKSSNRERIYYNTTIVIPKKGRNITHLIPFSEEDFVQDILDRIYFLIKNEIKVLPYEYMKSWVLKEEKSGRYLIMQEITDWVPAKFVFKPNLEWVVVGWDNSFIHRDKF